MDRMQWEYKTVRPRRDPTKKEATDPVDERNDLGARGWEVVTTIDYAGGGTKFIIASVRVSESRSQRIQMNDGRFETLDGTRAS